MDVGREDFEAGIYGNALELVMQYLSGGQPRTEKEIQSETGLETKSLNIALAKLQERGRIERKLLGPSAYYVAVTAAPSQDWYTIDESAGYLRVSRRTMYQLIRDGQMAAYRVGTGGHRRFRRDDLERLMQAEDSEVLQAMTAVADPVLAELWDNEKDAVYDRI
jgi:excisionase family DNA binding protein